MNAPSTRAWTVLRDALGLSPAEREAYVRARCAGDAGLRDEVLTLLRLDAGIDTAFDAPLDPVRILGERAEDDLGDTVGGYRLVAELGRGGMGAVYRAERIGGVAGHQVALKLIKRGMDSDEIVARFAREREILAQLKHPAIAQLIDGGVTERGRAWFALELVDGAPITAWCDERRLGIDARIAKFLDVCGAVQHAHRNLIVHRDLKPGNILVSTDGNPKLLDFGIAKLLDSAADGATRTGAALLTPEFAAPEQFRGEPVTTATDVYQLGLVLHELLGGARAAQTPARLSAALGDADRAAAAARARGTDAAALRRSLRGDLDRIVQKALDAEPARRYESVGDFAADLRRYLAREPVRARPDSVAYRVGRFVARHTAGTALATLAVVALLVATAYSAYQASVAREQLARATAVRQFLVGVFENTDPDKNQGQPITGQQLLAQGEQQLKETAGNAAIQADLTGLVGELYLNLGDHEHAAPYVQHAVELAADPRIPAEIRARNLRILATMERGQYQYDQAIEHAHAALAIAPTTLAMGERESTEVRRLLVDTLIAKGDLEAARPLLEDVLADDRVVHGEPSKPVAGDLALVGKVADGLGQIGPAEAAYRASIAMAIAIDRIDSDLAYSYNTLGILLRNKKADYAGSEAALREAERIYTKLFGADSRATVAVRSNILAGLELEGRVAEALPGRQQLLALAQRQTKGDAAYLAWALYFVARDYDALGRLAEAERDFRESLATWAIAQGSNRETESAYPMRSLALTLQLEGRYDEAEALLREVIANMGAHPGATSAQVRDETRGQLGNLLRLAHRYDEARAETAAAVAALAPAGAGSDLSLVVARAELAEAELDAGQAEAAETEAEAAVALARKLGAGAKLRSGAPLYALARVKLSRGHADEAEPLLREALAVRSPPHPADDLRVLEVEVALCTALRDEGKAGEADALRKVIAPELAQAKGNRHATDLLARLESDATGVAAGK